MNLNLGLFALILCAKCTVITGSDGDQSTYYQKCLRICIYQNCTGDGDFKESTLFEQDVWSKVTLWSCGDECRYQCMWETVKVFDRRGAGTPKFHGKWPFVKFLGMQEPASAFSSMLNLAANAHMYLKMKREFSVRNTPRVLFWHCYAIVCMNAWVWSTIFHTRDKPFTEFMDYACALSMVMGLFVSAVFRLFHRRRKLTAVIVSATLFYFVTHVRYLYSGRIDYDYNMRVNVFFGACGWCLWAWRGLAARGRRVLQFAGGAGAALALELLDFPPAAHVWDAHALWHLATAPLPLLFFGFVIDDLRHFQTGIYEKMDLKLTN